MRPIGKPDEWVGLIDTFVPDILELVLSTWEKMPELKSNSLENPVTKKLCKLMIQDKKSTELPFRIHYQSFELEPVEGENDGEIDIAFFPANSSRENIYFGLECKRLHVISGGQYHTLATKYVTEGMMRFIRGQYSPMVNNGGMLGYVLDGNVTQAIQNVSDAIQNRFQELGMETPGQMLPSSVHPEDSKIKETHHSRQHVSGNFKIHHIFATGVLKA